MLHSLALLPNENHNEGQGANDFHSLLASGMQEINPEIYDINILSSFKCGDDQEEGRDGH